MSIDEVEKINNLIERAQIESAKSKGKIEQIEKDWKEKYGTSDLDEVISIKDKMESDLKSKEKEAESLYDDLVNGYDWEQLEEELNEN
jgi:hypothetical protein